jgi:hypothetical protein
MSKANWLVKAHNYRCSEASKSQLPFFISHILVFVVQVSNPGISFGLPVILFSLNKPYFYMLLLKFRLVIPFILLKPLILFSWSGLLLI